MFWSCMDANMINFEIKDFQPLDSEKNLGSPDENNQNFETNKSSTSSASYEQKNFKHVKFIKILLWIYAKWSKCYIKVRF